MILNKNHSFWQLAFRPAFLLGTVYSAIIVFAWVLFFTGIIPYTGSMPLLAWHIHEMIIGFISLIIFGFLFTATQNWTGIRGVHGQKLQVFMLAWVAGRVLSVTPIDTSIIFISDLVYLSLGAYLLSPYLLPKSQNRNKIFFVVTLVLLIIAGGLTQIKLINNYFDSRELGFMAVGLVLLVISIIAGRIIPFFTKNAVANSKATKNITIEWLSHIFSVLPFITYAVMDIDVLNILMFTTAAVVHMIRWCLWKPWQTLQNPILLILPLSYLWIVFGFIAIASVYFKPSFFSLALHSINIGLIGSIIIAMVSRVSLGHTGRKIKATKLMIASYIAIQLTALLRFLLGAIPSFNYLTSVKISGYLWSLAFILLFISLIPLLTKPRPDGRIG